MDALHERIERLYVTFRSYRAGSVAGCPCCVSPEEQAVLKTKRLRELNGQDLGGFAFSALSTWGTLSDFKHFLPRILELKAEGQMWTDLQIIYGKVLYEGPWLPEELDALGAFSAALAMRELERRRIRHLMDVLESAGYIGLDIVPILEPMLVPHACAERASQLAEWVMYLGSQLADRDFTWTWWKTGAVNALKVWMLDGRLRRYLTETFEAYVEDPRSGTWAAASDILEALEAS